jgi:hypothetical protein
MRFCCGVREDVSAAERRKRQAEAASPSKDEMYLWVSEWSDKPALDIVEDQPKLLAEIVNEAARHFVGSSTPPAERN